MALFAQTLMHLPDSPGCPGESDSAAWMALAKWRWLSKQHYQKKSRLDSEIIFEDGALQGTVLLLRSNSPSSLQLSLINIGTCNIEFEFEKFC
jgi:hypothetical protein